MKDHASNLEKIFALRPSDTSYPLQVEGELPSWLKGTYYVNGPGQFQKGDLRYQHWLDGDGLVCRLHFDESGVSYSQRFVCSTKRTEEELAGKPLYRCFGTAFEGDQLKRGLGLETPVNVSAFPWNGRLLAFGEQGLPWDLDLETLETRGEFDFGGRLNAISPLSAHPCFDPHSGEMLNFGISFSSRHPCLHLYRFAPDGDLVYRRRLPIDAPRSVHDFGISPSFAIFYLSPQILDPEKLLKGGSSVMDALDWRPEAGTYLLIVDRESGQIRARVDLEPVAYCLHLINCFEDESHLYVDVIELSRPIYDQYQPLPDLFTDAPAGRPIRLKVQKKSWTLESRTEIPYDKTPDFPAIHPTASTRPYEHFWMLGISASGRPGRKFFDELVRGDWSRPEAIDRFRAPKGSFLGNEPVFLPDPGREDRGLVICKLFEGETGSDAFVVFDAFDLARGPRARLPLREASPPGFHTSFLPASS